MRPPSSVVYNRRVAKLVWPLAVSLCSLLPLTVPSARITVQPSPRPAVAIDGIDASYGSCSIVKFVVRNASSQSVYVKIYAENSAAAAWEPVACQYDLNDPRTRSAKLGLSQRNLIRAGGSMAVAYDRCSDHAYCMVPKLGTYDAPLSAALLQHEDARATPPVTQRIRVDAYWREQADPDAVIFSKPFRRAPPP
jgi:hypothetical protein